MNRSYKTGILFLTQGNIDHASTRIRGVNYFPILRRQGYRVKWVPRIPRKMNSFTGKYLLFPLLKRVNRLRIYVSLLTGGYRILFIQRLFLPARVLSYVRTKGKKIIFDFDDAIYYAEDNSQADVRTRTMAGHADLVLTSSPVLREWAQKLCIDCEVIHSPVNTELITPAEKRNGEITIGWIGSEWTSKYLDPLEDVFIHLYEKYGINFLMAGARQDILPGLKKTVVPWSPEKEALYLSQMDIGIMPLSDGEFEKGKGGYKLFQYMAAGIPVVASPVGINREIVEDGINGYLCSDKTAWLVRLSTLIEKKTLREEMGTNGRRKVLLHYSLEVCSEKLVHLIEKLNQCKTTGFSPQDRSCG